MNMRASEIRLFPLSLAVCAVTVGAVASDGADLPVAAIADEVRAQAAEYAGMQEVLVKYRAGDTRLDADRLSRILRETEAGFGHAAGLQRVRRDSAGMDVIRAARRLHKDEALTLLRGLARNRQVEYALTHFRGRGSGAVGAVGYSEIWASSEYDGNWSDRWSISQ